MPVFRDILLAPQTPKRSGTPQRPAPATKETTMSTKNLSAPTLELLTAREAAEILNIGLNTMYVLLRFNDVPNLRLGRQYMIPRESLYQWVIDKAAESVR